MSFIGLSSIEKEMANFNFEQLATQVKASQNNFTSAKSATDIKSEICSVWSKIGKYVKLAEAVPVVGKFITILAELLDSLCAS